MFSCFLARAGATALERPRVARGRSLPRRFFLCANGRVKARDWILVCFNSFLFLIRCRSALEADAEESSRMVDLEFISRESWLEVGLQNGARVFSPRRQVNKVGVGFPSARVRARVDAYTGPGLCSRFLIEQRFLKQQSVAGAGAQLSSAALRSPASPALRLQPAAQIGELCNMRCSVSWPFGSMEDKFC